MQRFLKPIDTNMNSVQQLFTFLEGIWALYQKGQTIWLAIEQMNMLQLQYNFVTFTVILILPKTFSNVIYKGTYPFVWLGQLCLQLSSLSSATFLSSWSNSVRRRGVVFWHRCCISFSLCRFCVTPMMLADAAPAGFVSCGSTSSTLADMIARSTSMISYKR